MTNKMKYFFVVSILAFGCGLIAPSTIDAQPPTHTVVKGDTLWDICEKYYGDPNLWPKLWQMNPFITNPHLLDPGDVVTLMEIEPTKEGIESIKEAKAPEEEGQIPGPMPLVTGIDVSSLINIKAIGFLSRKKVKPWGQILVLDRRRVMSSRDETVFVVFDKSRAVKPGDEFAVCQYSPMLKYPRSRKRLGYLLSMHGRLVVEEPVGVGTEEGKVSEKQHAFKAKILESYVDIHAGDLIIPYEPVSACVIPRSIDPELVTNIVAVKDQMELIGLYFVIYIDRGFNHGIRRGDLFKVVEARPSPTRKVTLPERVLGRIIILESRPDTATALVLSAKQDFSNGSYIKGLSYVEPPTFLTMLPRCPIE